MKKILSTSIEYENKDWGYLFKLCPHSFRASHRKASFTEAAINVNTVTKSGKVLELGGIQTILCRLYWN